MIGDNATPLAKTGTEPGMTTLAVTLTLPEAMTEEAARTGLLAPDALQSLLRDAIRGRRIECMFAAMDALQEARLPPPTDETPSPPAAREAAYASANLRRRDPHDAARAPHLPVE
jgi:hypothetical protein